MSKKKLHKTYKREKSENILFKYPVLCKTCSATNNKKRKNKNYKKKKQEKDLFVIPKILMTSLLYKIH